MTKQAEDHAPFDWPVLMHAGMGRLGLPSQEFWGLTPAELIIRLRQGQTQSTRPMGRAGLEELMRAYPDDPVPQDEQFDWKGQDNE